MIFVVNSTSGGGGLALETDGSPNGSQVLLNLEGGNNIFLTDDGLGTVTIDGVGIAGTNTQVLFFDGNDTPSGDSGLTYNKTTNKLSVSTIGSIIGENFAVSATAPAATTGASQAGKTATISASNAVASLDTAGAAVGGDVTITGGNAARLTSGNANGGNVILAAGTGIGSGTQGQIRLLAGSNLVFSDATTTGWVGFGANKWYYIANGTPTLMLTSTGVQLRSDITYSWTSGSDPTTSPDTWLSRGTGARIVHIGNADGSVIAANTLGFQGALAGTDTNTSGATSTIRGSLGTGNATATSLVFQTGTSVASGTGQHTSTTRLTMNDIVSAFTTPVSTVSLSLIEGSNASMGVVTLSGGTTTVNTTRVTANSRIFLTVQSLGTVTVATPIAVTARTASTSFTITSSDVTDTSVVAWMIVEPS